MLRVRVCVALMLSIVQAAAPSSLQGLSVAGHTEPAPDELAEGVRARLAEGGARVQSGQTVLEFWWVGALPATQALDPGPASWSAVLEGSLVGAVRLSEIYPDIRGRTIDPGVYTLRYGVQPADGDHLGISPFREFLLLSPAAEDVDAAPISHNDLVDLSKRSINVSHPAVWSLDPPVSDAEALTAQTTEEGHAAVVFEVPVAFEEQTAGSLRFGLILVGRIEA